MKVIVAGSRECKDIKLVHKAIDAGLKALDIEITELVSGGARGVDKTAEDWARKHGIVVTQFVADWNNLNQPGAKIKTRNNPWTKKHTKYNANAGFYRNILMAQYADALIAIDLNTPGTNHMIEQARNHNCLVFIYKIKPPKNMEYDF